MTPRLPPPQRGAAQTPSPWAVPLQGAGRGGGGGGIGLSRLPGNRHQQRASGGPGRCRRRAASRSCRRRAQASEVPAPASRCGGAARFPLGPPAFRARGAAALSGGPGHCAVFSLGNQPGLYLTQFMWYLRSLAKYRFFLTFPTHSPGDAPESCLPARPPAASRCCSLRARLVHRPTPQWRRAAEKSLPLIPSSTTFASGCRI